MEVQVKTKARNERERRQNRRLVTSAAIGVAVARGFLYRLPGRPEWEATLVDASMTGLQLRLVKPLRKGERVKLWIPIPGVTDPQGLVLPGDIIWSRPEVPDESVEPMYVVGVRLRRRPAHALEVWERYIAERLRFHDL